MRHHHVLSFLFLFIPMSLMAKTPNFTQIDDIKKRQKSFFSYLLPAAKQANNAIIKVRERIISLKNQWSFGKKLSKNNKIWLQQVAKDYKLSGLSFTKDKDWKQLLLRVDMIPVSMLLAQAANESAWGTSRFAQKGNNFFGQWCFKAGCGIVPKMRPSGRIYEVARFNSPYDSVKSYLKNLNTNNGYKLFRKLRAMERETEGKLNGLVLAPGLINYSERKQKYVNSIKAIISRHNLEQFDIA